MQADDMDGDILRLSVVDTPSEGDLVGHLRPLGKVGPQSNLAHLPHPLVSCAQERAICRRAVV